VTADKFRELALEHLGAIESEHMGHPDFRVGGKVFASLGPKGDWGMVKVTPVDQAKMMKAEPEVYRPASGAWGRSGCTIVTLKGAKAASVRSGLEKAWRNVAPKALLKELDDPSGGAAQGAARALPSPSASGGLGKRKGSSNSSPRKRDPR
jgi:hypothetical protein